MKISINSIRAMNRRYATTGDIAAIGQAELEQKIGAQLGAIEETIDVGSKYAGIIVAKVVTCVKHPNADKLNVCMIDDGGRVLGVERDGQGLVQVVCGAPNVRAGLTVAWLPPGSTVPESFGKEPFVLSVRELRGVASNGMLASPREMAFGDSHDGILELNDEVAPGANFAEAYNLSGDYVVDIENKMFTHRPDCFGFLGVSRELAGIQHMPFISPEWYRPDAAIPAIEAEVLPLDVCNQLPELVPRFMVIAMCDVRVSPSPQWLQIELSKVGQRSINNIVDLTNFFMLETGQPLHAYDYDKVKALDSSESATIVIRHPSEGEKITLLNGKEITPRPEAVMIASATTLIGLGGVMGGGDTEVDDGTTNIIIEVATFDMYSIRRTSMAHGLFTDAVSRFNKGQSPLQNQAVLAKMVDDVRKLTGGKVASQLIDIKNPLVEEALRQGTLHMPVSVDVAFINGRLGLQLTTSEICSLLTNVEFKVDVSARNDGDSLQVKAPFWRTDIEISEDVVEEVGRLYGYDRLSLELPSKPMAPASKNPLLEVKQSVRQALSWTGANELLTYSFVPGKVMEKAGQDPETAFKLSNALSPDLQYYRLSLMPSLLDKVHANIKAGYDEFALFEIGKGHNLLHVDDDDGLPSEFEMLELVYTSADKLQRPGTAFYQAKKYLESLAAQFGLELAYAPADPASDYPITKPYDLSRSAMVTTKSISKSTGKSTGDFLGMIGELRPEVLQNFKLPARTAVFGIGLLELKAAAAKASIEHGPSYRPLSRFPKIEQDICLKVAADVSYQTVYDFIETTVHSLRPENSTSMLSPVDIYRRDDHEGYKQITIRLSIASHDKTLRDNEVAEILDKVAGAAYDELHAERI